MGMGNPYAHDLDKNPANYQPLTPLSYLARAALVFPDKMAIIHGNQRVTYAQYYARNLPQHCRRPVWVRTTPCR
jgi:fatty-acyl-CoA synthase